MRVITVVFSAIIVGIAYAQITSSDECTLSCSVTSQPNPNNDGSFVVIIDHKMVYVYVVESNSYVVINLELMMVNIIDGNNGTYFSMNASTGFAFISNIHSNLVYAIIENVQPFDLTTIGQGDYSVVISIIEYASQYTTKVVGDNIDTNQAAYTDIFTILHDMATTTNYTEWSSFNSNSEVLVSLFESTSKVTSIMYELLNSGQYTEEWGVVMYFIIASEQYKTTDELQLAFVNFMVSIVRALQGKFTTELMEEYYMIIANQGSQSTVVTLQQYAHLTWAINGVGTTYETLEMAMTAYREQTVVQTYLSTIVVNSSNQSYITYNSMRNGTWLFRIDYGIHQYVQVTASYYDEYMGIIDPSLDYTMVFTNTDKFGFINYKTGNGFIIDGTHNKAIYVISNDQNIVTAFAEARYIDGFKLVRNLVTSDFNNTNSFVATDFFIAVQNGESLDSMLNPEQLDSVNNDFNALLGELSGIDFTNSFGISNIAQVMLDGPNTPFFHEGFVKMLSRMFSFNLAGGAFYRICYAGILDDLNNDFQEQLFINTYNVMEHVKKNQSKNEIISFLEMYVKVTTFIDVTSEEFTRDGSIISES